MRAPVTHFLPITRAVADAKLRGEKRFEIRYNNLDGFQKGDRVRYTVVESEDDPTAVDDHPLTKCMFEVTLGYRRHRGLAPGYVVFEERLVPAYER